jgi:hypothetical protein
MLLITDTIEQKKQLLLKATYSDSVILSDLFLCPYVFGIDCRNYEFVWAYLPNQETFYKLLILHVQSAEIIDLSFEVLPFACYQYAQADELPEIVEGFENMYAGAAVNVNPGRK